MIRTIREWLLQNPGPYNVCLFTVKPGENPADFTAGRVIFPADAADARDGVVVFYQHREDETTGEIILVEGALANENISDDNSFTADYENLTVPVDGFFPCVIVTIQQA